MSSPALAPPNRLQEGFLQRVFSQLRVASEVQRDAQQLAGGRVEHAAQGPRVTGLAEAQELAIGFGSSHHAPPCNRSRSVRHEFSTFFATAAGTAEVGQQDSTNARRPRRRDH